MTAAIDCPLPACDWTYTPALSADALVEARSLGQHFAEHTTREWVSGLRVQQDALARILAAWDATRSNLSSPFAPKYQDELREAIRSAREWVGTEVTP